MKKYIIKSILCILLIMILTSLTIYYLLSMVNISNEEYLKILLSKSYGNDFYKTVVDTIGKRFNFMNFITGISFIKNHKIILLEDKEVLI